MKYDLVTVDDGARLWVASNGSGAPLVLCHGGPGLHDDLGDVAAMVDDIHTVYRWDQRGSGRSSPVGPYTIARFVADLDALRRHYGHERWIVGGHSWGANLALFYTLAHPEHVQALLYLSGTGLAWPKWKGAYRAEEEARLSLEERIRVRELKAKQRTAPEEMEYLILNDLPNFADRARAWKLAAADVEAMGRYPVNYMANRVLNTEAEALDEAEMVRKCAALRGPALVLDGEADPRPAARWTRLLLRCPCARASPCAVWRICRGRKTLWPCVPPCAGFLVV